MLEKRKTGTKKISITGMGYVGLPLALAFGKHYDVIGYDIDTNRVDLLKQQIDPAGEIDAADFTCSRVTFTADANLISEADVHIIALPTPVNNFNAPDLGILLAGTRTVAGQLKRGDIVVFESTVYPGCTEDDCIPILELVSGLKYLEDFFVAYSPERVNPGDKKHTIDNVVKVVSAGDENTLEQIAALYGSIVKAGIHKAPTIKVAEAAKIIENTQRDLNIALMNELSIIFDRMDISTVDVIEAAATKWNFMPYYPGMVGGHCIGVDPYYMTYKARKLGYDPQVILGGRRINDDMPAYIARRTVQQLIELRKNPLDCRVLVLGITFKENVRDIRNSKVTHLVKELQNYRVDVTVVDSNADAEEVMMMYDILCAGKVEGPYDAIIQAVKHDQYAVWPAGKINDLLTRPGLIMDIKSAWKNYSWDKDIHYWAL